MNEEAYVLDLEIDASAAVTGAERFDQAVDGVADSAGRAAAAADKAGDAMDGMGRAANADAAVLDKLRMAADPLTATTVRMVEVNSRAERALERVKAQADPLYAAQQRLARQTDILDQSFRAGLLTEEEKIRTLAQLHARYDSLADRLRGATTAQTSFAAANDNAARSSSRMGGIMQQVGFQVGDAATQIAMGGSAVQALSVQGAQLLGVFGPWGAVIGAAVVVVGALGSALFGTKKEADGAADALDTYGGALKLANELTGDAARAARELAEAQRQQAIQTRRTAVDQAEAAVTAVQSQIAQLEAIRALGRFDAASPGDTSDTFTQAGVQIDILRKGMSDLETTLKKAQIGLAEASQGVGEFGAVTDRASKKTKAQKGEADLLIDGVAEYIVGLQETTRLMRLDTDERAKQEAVQRAQALAMKEGNLLGEDQIRIIREQIGLQQDLRDVEEKRRKAEQEAKREAESTLREADRLREKADRDAQQTVDDITRYSADAFADLWGETGRGFKDTLDDMATWARQTFARITADAVIRPRIEALINFTGLGATSGRSTGSTGSAGGSLGSLSNVSDIGKLFSLGSGGTLSPAIDALNPFGAFADVGTGFVGPLQPGMTAGIGTFSNVLGIAGAVLPGLISGNYAQAAAGGIGAAIGTLILPGIGTALGGTLGNPIGRAKSGLFTEKAA